MLKVALPNKGQLYQPSVDLLIACGYKAQKHERSLSTIDHENGIEFYFLRPGDIPVYVEQGILDLGFTGKDFIAEKEVSCGTLLDLNFGHSKLCAAVPNESSVQTLDELKKIRVATSFPAITTNFYNDNSMHIVELEGAVEISVRLGIADAVIDIVETGTTLVQAGLRIVGEPLFRSNAVVLHHRNAHEKEPVKILKSRLQGKMLADAYKMVEFDCPAQLLDQAVAIVPGIESPTVTNLAAENWKSVKSMVLKSESNRIMDALSQLGCKGIVLTRIESARI